MYSVFRPYDGPLCWFDSYSTRTSRVWKTTFLFKLLMLLSSATSSSFLWLLYIASALGSLDPDMCVDTAPRFGGVSFSEGADWNDDVALELFFELVSFPDRKRDFDLEPEADISISSSLRQIPIWPVWRSPRKRCTLGIPAVMMERFMTTEFRMVGPMAFPVTMIVSLYR